MVVGTAVRSVLMEAVERPLLERSIIESLLVQGTREDVVCSVNLELIH